MANILQAINSAANCKTISKCIEMAGLSSELSGPGPLTFCCPTDEAFSKLPAGALDKLMKDIPGLKNLVNNHIFATRLTAEDLRKTKSAKTRAGETVTVEGKAAIKLKDATVTKQDVKCDNGIVHMIDRVIMPAKMAKAA